MSRENSVRRGSKHKIDNLRQVFDLVDKIAVFRQGRIIDVVKTSEVTGNDVVALITGLDKKNREVGEYI